MLFLIGRRRTGELMDKTISQLYDRYYAKQKQADALLIEWQSKANALAEVFNVHRPIVKFIRGCRGYYRRSKRLVCIGKNAWRGVETTFLHEIAHHITFERFGNLKQHHGRKFKGILWAVAEKHYGNPSDYSWCNEYPSVKQYAKKKFVKASPSTALMII